MATTTTEHCIHTSDVLRLVGERTAEQHLTTADFAADELGLPIRTVRACLQQLVQAGQLARGSVGLQVVYTAR